MDLIPLIYIENKKIRISKKSNPVSVKDFIKNSKDKKKIYILDLDGIDRNKPNLCTYQRLVSFYDIWVDNGPRNLGDIVDTTMAGATDITLRKELSPQLTLKDIREITENKIFGNIELNKANKIDDVDGLVVFEEAINKSDFKINEVIKNMVSKNKTYLYVTDIKTKSNWENLGVAGLLIDLGKIKEL